MSIYWIARLIGLLLAGASLSSWADCTTVTSQSIAFGIYSPIDGAPRDSMGSVSVTCNGRLLGPDVGSISISTGISGNYASRTMSNGAQRLAYNLYTDPGRSTVFGDGSRGTGTVGFSAGGIRFIPSTVSVPIYARAFARQDVAPGQYVDTLVITVTY
ncbi:spore coat U domain-containing protein [uncultured Salinisphaera sp.]|uniref:Csu type fimbrial protein n=1 Tax=uncultured Salinisphaera sp. TaxID=359372 RepID=UPI0032B1B409|tara:strand:+ start:5420 stop:5893 length:474 start_codon:yes stop_codon:yes gene_type:complete